MAETITRNLLLKEDIAFDTNGTGQTVDRNNPAGGTLSGNKINATHLPTTVTLRALMTGTSTVEDTLRWLYQSFSEFGGDATTTEKGIIEIATLAEANAGTDTAKALTPYLFKNVKASTTQFGTTTLASTAEAITGTEAEKVITPVTLEAKLADSLENFAMDGVERGMILSMNATDPEHDIDISPGRVADSTYSYGLELSTTMTKQIDATWEAGNNVGGMPSTVALTADTWYHLFTIYNPTTQTTDLGFDTDINAVNLLADATGYTKYRRRGSVLTDSSSYIISFRQVGNHFYWLNDMDQISIASTGALQTIDTPLGVQVKVRILVHGDDETRILVCSPYIDTNADWRFLARADGPDDYNMVGDVFTNESSQVYTKSSNQTGYLRVLGWMEPTL